MKGCQYHCTVCTQDFNDKLSFKSHIIDSHNLQTFEHYVRVYGDPTTSMNMFNCELCSEVMTHDPEDIGQHLSEIHQINPTTYKQRISASSHVQSQPQVVKQRQYSKYNWSLNVHFCPYCSSSLAKSKIASHVKNCTQKGNVELPQSHTNLRHNCFICGTSVLCQVENVKKHLSTVHKLTLIEYEDKFADRLETLFKGLRKQKRELETQLLATLNKNRMERVNVSQQNANIYQTTALSMPSTSGNVPPPSVKLRQILPNVTSSSNNVQFYAIPKSNFNPQNFQQNLPNVASSSNNVHLYALSNLNTQTTYATQPISTAITSLPQYSNPNQMTPNTSSQYYSGTTFPTFSGNASSSQGIQFYDPNNGQVTYSQSHIQVQQQQNYVGQQQQQNNVYHHPNENQASFHPQQSYANINSGYQMNYNTVSNSVNYNNPQFICPDTTANATPFSSTTWTPMTDTTLQMDPLFEEEEAVKNESEYIL